MNKPVETEFYDLLGIEYTATNEEIKRAYRKKALIHHPDKGGDEDTFKKINLAYETLSNPEKKDLYDRQGKNGLNEDHPTMSQETFSEIFSNLFHGGNIFSNLFQQRHDIPKTPPYLYTYQAKLEDLCTRRVVTLKFNRDRLCNCVNNKNKCDHCNGQGYIVKTKPIGPGMIQQIHIQCDSCCGKGNIYSFCGECKEGKIVSPKKFELHLTPNLEDGYRYVFNNEGNQILEHEPGDFVIIIKHANHPVFKVENNDLLMTKKLTLLEALCGHSFSVTHPSGENLMINIEDITTCNTVRILPKGIGNNGVLKISYDIVFPEKLDNLQKEKLRSIL